MSQQGRSYSIPLRLALMMFLQYAALGAWVVPLSGWLVKPAAMGGLGFNSQQTASIYMTLAVGGLVAPFITGLLADRYFASEKLVGILHLAMAVAQVVAGRIAGEYAGAQADPDAVWPQLFVVLLLYSVACVLAITVGNTLAMRSLANPHKTFGLVRLCGTLGWIVACFVVELAFIPHSPDLFYVAAVFHFVLGVIAWWLPHTPPKGKGRPIAEVMGLPATKLFRDRSFVVFALVAFVTQIMQQFYTVFANPFMIDIKMPQPGAVMSIAQIVEMGCMAAMPLLISRFGLKRTMALGLFAWCLRNAVLMSGGLTSVTFVALPMHGISYTFFTIVSALYIDREAPAHLRAGAQALLAFVSGGPGTLIGFYLSGLVKDIHTQNAITNWPPVWMVPLIGYVIATVFFLIFFHEPRIPQTQPLPAQPDSLSEKR